MKGSTRLPHTTYHACFFPPKVSALVNINQEILLPVFFAETGDKLHNQLHRLDIRTVLSFLQTTQPFRVSKTLIHGYMVGIKARKLVNHYSPDGLKTL